MGALLVSHLYKDACWHSCANKVLVAHFLETKALGIGTRMQLAACPSLQA